MIMIGKNDLLLVVPQFEIRHVIILNFGGCLVGLTCLFLLLGLLSLLLQFLGCLLWLARKVPLVDLPTQDGGLGPVTSLYAESSLFQNKLGFFPSAHGPKGLDLQFTEDVGSGIQIALAFLDV